MAWLFWSLIIINILEAPTESFIQSSVIAVHIFHCGRSIRLESGVRGYIVHMPCGRQEMGLDLVVSVGCPIIFEFAVGLWICVLGLLWFDDRVGRWKGRRCWQKVKRRRCKAGPFYHMRLHSIVFANLVQNWSCSFSDTTVERARGSVGASSESWVSRARDLYVYNLLHASPCSGGAGASRVFHMYT